MIAKMWKKNREVLSYLFFGACTTGINIIVYMFFSDFAETNTVISTGTAWFGSVIFAYYTNRRWVFASKTRGRYLISEFIAFMACRLFSGIMDVAIMYVSVDLLGYQDMIMKIVTNILVIVANFVVSKLVVFKNR